MARVFWKPDEITKLVDNTASLIRATPFKTFLDALRESQALLPEDRRRKINSVVPFIELEKMVKDKLSIQAEAVPAPIPTTENPVAPAEPSAPIHVLRKEEVEEMVTELFFKMIDPIVDTLMTEVSNRLAVSVKETLATTVSSFLSSYKNIQNGNGNGKAAVAAKKVNAAVVGLTGDQPTHIDKSFKDRFNITYYDSQDGASERLQSMVESKDVVFVNVKFVSHSKIDCAKFASGKLVKYHGGMSQLKGLLEEYWRKMNPNG